MLLALFFQQLVRNGHLTVIDAAGRKSVYGNGRGIHATIRFHDKAVERRLLIDRSLAFGEAWMDGRITVEEGDLYTVLALLMENIMTLPPSRLSGPLNALRRRIQQFNPISRARQNVAHHYDLSGALYDLFLDSDRQYSCGYFVDPTDDLETAQLAKKRHIAAKLLLKPGMKILDIGCGWGGLALYLAQETGADVTGLTLSVEQQKMATDRARATGLSDRVRFELRDYREDAGRYDRIVSVGMFEHVGVNHYGTFFKQINGLLKDDGIALLHAIGRSDGPGITDSWMRKYIFPGGYSPALSEVIPHLEKTGFWLTDVEILRLHYAETLKHWRLRFARNRDRAVALYDERFCRMWEFYLAGCELGFRVQSNMVFQLQFAKNIGAVPITRDYIIDWEADHATSGTRAAFTSPDLERSLLHHAVTSMTPRIVHELMMAFHHDPRHDAAP